MGDCNQGAVAWVFNRFYGGDSLHEAGMIGYHMGEKLRLSARRHCDEDGFRIRNCFSDLLEKLMGPGGERPSVINSPCDGCVAPDHRDL